MDMSALRTSILITVAVVAAVSAPAGWAKDTDKPPLPPFDPNAAWREQIALPEDAFLVQGAAQNEPAWVKFTIVLLADGSHKVYFQDGNQYLFHYQFAAKNLEPFAGMTPEQFDRVTLYREGRQAVLGAVIAPAIGVLSFQPHEYGIQLVGRDPFTKEEVAQWCGVIRQCVLTQEPFAAFYFPTYEQQATAEADGAWLEAQGFPISSPDRWAQDDICYSPGWTIGTLKHIKGSDIRQAYLDGSLKSTDVLLTDGVPAETPSVAGIITLSPSTPNSHVAILAKTFGVPFVHLAVPETQKLASLLVGHRICLRAYDTYGRTEIRLIDTEGILDDATAQEILALKKPPQLAILPVTLYGSYAADTNGLDPCDIGHFGGKAANYGILRRAIPDNCPVAVAFSFDLWNDFLSQKLANGRSLRETIAGRLAGFTYPPADMEALSSKLSDTRNMFTDAAVTGFTEAQRQAVLCVLQDPRYGFDPSQNLRFRSSTNVEDSLEFTGAGLYDSFSGCLGDDLDADNTGPCLCDPDRGRERGVFVAIRKVFASFYNENAYLERLRHDINDSDVAMAMLVHPSFPDGIELANGVAEVKCDAESNSEITLVTQQGAVSVTNPPEGSIPEETTVWASPFGMYIGRGRQSNLVQLGATVMQWEDDYAALAELLMKVGDEFAVVVGRKQITLEMEYKKLAPDGRLIVKQVREIPEPNDTPSITPFLMNEPTRYCLLQGESGDVFAHHRLKSFWRLETGNLWLTEKNLNGCLYGQTSLEYEAEGRIGTLAGRISDWPKAAHSYSESSTTDTWRIGDLENPRTCRLQTNSIRTLVGAAESAVVTVRDFGYPTLEVEYEKPVLCWQWPGLSQTTTDHVLLCPYFEPSSQDQLQRRRFEDSNGVTIETSFYWPPTPKGPVAGYTAPLARWVETRIAGHTSEPIVLRGWYSQTYKPEHHNFSEHFLFEPQLEPDLSPDVLAELRKEDIRLIHVYTSFDQATITTYGFNFQPPPPITEVNPVE
jgi:hypothetical protein